MAIKTSYYDGQSYTAADDVAPWKSLLEDGIFNVASGALAVTQNTTPNLSVNVAAGSCIESGYYIKSDSVVNVPIVANVSGFNRIDIIVVEINASTKVTTIKAVQGTGSSAPTAPIPTSTQLKLADVSVGNNVSVINTVNITDKRINVDLFGNQLANKASKTLDFVNSKGVNGYTFLPNGYILQKGKIYVGNGVDGGRWVTVSLPISYSNTNFAVVLTDANNIDYNTVKVASISSNGSFVINSKLDREVYWMAIGD